MIKQIIYRLLPDRLKQYIRNKKSQEYAIIHHPENVFPIVYHIKDISWEHVHMPEVYNLMKAWENFSLCPAQGILEFPTCEVYSSTDIITMEDKCVWDKVEFDIFSKIVPLDKNLLSYDYTKIRRRKPKKTVEVVGFCISMLGVHETVWTHFLIQFLPKLYYAEEAGLLDREDITILMPDYKDENILELVEDVLCKHPKLKMIICDSDPQCAYRCEKLFFIPTASVSSNHAHYILPYDVVIPQRVLDILKEKVVNPRVNIAREKIHSHLKLYLVRRSSMRGLKNYQEVEDYFSKKGFIMVEPHKLSLQEKANLFSAAEYIAGPASGAWTNVIFCRQAKGVFLNTMCRTIDAYSKYLMQLGHVDILQVTGWDYSTSSIHSDYSIPIEKIDAAYKQFIGEAI